VDLLEHLVDDGEFIIECQRLLKSNGQLIINVPNPKEGILRKFRFLIGQTDEQHGHVRPGYDLAALRTLLGANFKVECVLHYNRIFSQLVDTLILSGLHFLKAGKEGQKGTVVTSDTIKKRKKEFFLFSLISPFLHAAVFLDNFVPFLHGNSLIIRAVKSS
jgi:predicted SAM-dependent methyltransferase